MALQKRERILIGVVAALAAAAVVWFLWDTGPATDLLRKECEKKRSELAALQQRSDDADKALAKLKQWEKRALPSRPDAARSSYLHWLRGLVERLKLREVQVGSTDDQRRGQNFSKLTFTLHGRATLEQVTRLLHEFYSAGHLHSIRRLALKPADSKKGGASGELEIQATIEAVSLSSADRTAQLTKLPGQPLQHGNFEAYRKVIVRRLMEGNRFVDGGGVFMAYVEPPPPRVVSRVPPPAPRVEPKGPPPRDDAKFTTLTAIVESAGRREAWFRVKSTEESHQIAEGQSFKVGGKSVKVLKIRPHEVDIELDGQQRRVPRGSTLREGTLLADASKTTRGAPNVGDPSDSVPPKEASSAADTPKDASSTKDSDQAAQPDDKPAAEKPAADKPAAAEPSGDKPKADATAAAGDSTKPPDAAAGESDSSKTGAATSDTPRPSRSGRSWGRPR